MNISADWAMVIITIVYVGATIAICIFNYKSAKATREQVTESRRQFQENNRAFVTVTLEIIRGGLLTLKIHNYGHQIASNVKVGINRSFIDAVVEKDFQRRLSRLCDSTLMLGMNQSYHVVFASNRDLSKFNENIIDITVNYSDAFSQYCEKTTIDISQYGWSLIYDSSIGDTCQELRKISSNLQSIDTSINSLKK